MSGSSNIKSLEKALKVLECFTVEKQELGISEISQQLNLYKSNVYNIISTFEAAGYIEKNIDTCKYHLGHKLMQLSHIYSTSMTFKSIIYKCIKELSAVTDEIVYFAVPNGEDVMYIEGSFPDKCHNVRWVQGMTAPMVCTAIGKAMLAYMDDEFINKVLSKPLTRYTEFTITEPDLLREELKKTFMRGYSLDNMEHEYGIKCVGVPVFNRSRELIGALSITGPSLRFSDEQSKNFSDLIKEKVEIIKQSL